MKAKEKTPLTYVESKDEQPFDWYEFLNRTVYTTDELREARMLAGHWVTCACGNQCEIIPRDEFDGEPFDKKLSKLGLEFYSVIDAMYFRSTVGVDDKPYQKKALKILNKIEARSFFLICEELNKKNEK